MTEQNSCIKCGKEHCQHISCERQKPNFVGLRCARCRENLHYNTIHEQAKKGTGHKFAPTRLTYFSNPTGYQYVHLNTGICFRSEETNPERAGAIWLVQLDHLDENKRNKINQLGLLGVY
jgi:hypothetical protein